MGQEMEMRDILGDDNFFVRHFCSDATIEKLRGINPGALRTLLRAIHELAVSPAFSTPRFWTPAGSAQAVVVSANLGRDGRMRGRRFGLCTDVSGINDKMATSFHIWANKEVVDDAVAKGVCGRDFLDAWRPWREDEEPGRYLRLEEPVSGLGSDQAGFEPIQHGNDLVAMLRWLEGQHRVTREVLQEIRPVLTRFGHSDDAITPMIVDTYRHPDIYDIESEKKKTRTLAVRRYSAPPREARSSVLEADRPSAALIVTSNTRPTETVHFGAQDLFTVEEAPPPSRELPFMNLSFKSRLGDQNNLKGAGLYGIFFDDGNSPAPGLIYVGLFHNGKKGSGTPFGGNILRTRWEKHIATCSIRGTNVGISSRTARSLLALQDDHPVRAMSAPSVADAIVRDRGCNAGENRVFFAKENWASIGDAEGDRLLSRFSFSYVRLTARLDHEDDDDIRGVIGSAEGRLKRALAPICNFETRVGHHQSGITVHEFVEAAHNALC
jgi:hypothetical protein